MAKAPHHGLALPRQARWPALLLLLLLAAACPGSSDDGEPSTQTGAGELPAMVHDTLGNAFSTVCADDAGDCHLTPLDPAATPSCGGGLDFYALHASDGVFRICYFVGEAGSTWGTTSAEDCRPLGCAGTGPCLGGRCRNGVCQYGSAAATRDDAIALCLADVPWPSSCERIQPADILTTRIVPIVERCTDSHAACDVPSECPQR